MATSSVFFLLALFLTQIKSQDDFPDAILVPDVIIESPKTTNWGLWGKEETCPSGKFAQAFQLNVEPEHPIDNTDVNGLRLYCGHPFTTTKQITSTVAIWGWYGQIFDCFPHLLTGFQLRVQPEIFGDNVATTNIRFICGESENSFTLEGDGTHRGEWAERMQCPPNHAICGLQTQVQNAPSPPDFDDSALNNIRVKCCPLN